MSRRGSDWTPFQPTRFEYLNKPVIWLPPLVATLEGETPVYLSGSRGTGKTTLLKALSYDMRLTNESLRSQLDNGSQAFRDRYIGLYLRLPDYVTMTFCRESSVDQQAPPKLFFAFSLMLELQSLQLLLSAVSKLRDAGVFTLSYEDELAIVAEVAAAWPVAAGAKSFRDVRARCLSLHTEIQARSFEVREDLDISGLPVGQFGSSLQAVAATVLRSPRFVAAAGEGWRIKICFDEAECLLPWQQRVVNSIVRLTKSPVSFVIAYVSRDFDTVSTYIHDLQLASDDRLLLAPLDDIPQAQYRRMTSEVANLYIRNVPGDVSGTSATFDVEQLLGPTNINALLLRLIERNKSTKSVALLERARTLQAHPYFAGRLSDYPDDDIADSDDVPPIYQTFLMERLRITLPEPTSPDWVRRQQDSAEMRKRMVAAFLAICDEYGWEPLFSGYHVAYNLSTNCIRDFLDELRFLYVESEAAGDTARFVALRNLSPDKQAAAFRAASESKRRSVPSEVPHYGTQVRNLLTTLGALLHQLHMNWRRVDALRSPERGKFTITASPSRHAFDLCHKYVQHAIDGGAIRFFASDADRLTFGLHRLLAPSFGFSYRRPQYEVKLQSAQLLQCVEAKDSGSLQRAIDELAGIAEVTGAGQQELPFGADA